jgi:hypothetical protein
MIYVSIRHRWILRLAHVDVELVARQIVKDCNLRMVRETGQSAEVEE